MRFIKNIPHKVLGISLYSVNRKYLIKFEKSDFEISFKLSENEVLNIEDLEAKFMNPDFLNIILNHFKDLNLQCSDLLEG